MPSLNDFAKQYAEYLIQHRASPTATSDVAGMIRGLTYTQSGERLSDSDVEKITEEMERILSQAHKREAPDGGMIIEAEDSRKFIEMVNQIRRKAKEK